MTIVPLPPLAPVSAGVSPAPNPEIAAKAVQAASTQPQAPAVPASDAMLNALKELAAVEAAPAQSVNVALQAAAASQGGLAQLMADLVQAQQTPDLPASVQAAIVQILALQSPLDAQVTGADIKAALTKSGLFPEANAAADLRASTATPNGAQPPPAATDIKTALLVLQQVLKTWLADVPARPPEPTPQPPALAGAKDAAPEPSRSPANNPLTPVYRGGATGSPQPPMPSTSAAAVIPALSPDAAAKPAPAASIPPQAQIVPSSEATLEAPPQLPVAKEAAAAPRLPASAPGSQALPASADIKTAPPALPQLVKTSLADAPAQPSAPEAQKDAAPSPLRSPAENPSAPTYRGPPSAQSAMPSVSPAPGVPAMSPEGPAKAVQPASTQAPAQSESTPERTMEAPQLPRTENTASVPQSAAPAVGPLPGGTDLKLALVIVQQLLKTSFGSPAQPYARAAASDAAPEPPRSAATNPPPPYRGGPTSAQPPILPTLFADANPRLVGQVLLSHAEAALAHLKLLQIASLPDAPSSPRSENQGSRWMFEIPFATPQGSAIAQFEISRDAGGGADASCGPVWRARFSLDVEPMGPVHAQVALMGTRAWVTLWAEREESVQTLRAQEGSLNQALKDSDFVAEVAFCVGAPRRRAAASGQFLDSAS